MTAASNAASGRGRGHASWFWTLSIGVVLGCVSPAAESARRDFYFEPLAVERGLLQNTVTAMLQDRDGYVWIGTQGGLHRYDGQGFRLFRHLPEDSGSLPDSFVTALAAGADGELWVGTNTRHVARLDLSTGVAQRFSSAAFANDERHQYVRALHYRDGAMWVASNAGVERFEGTTGTGRAVLELPPGEIAHDLAFTANGVGWVATSAGLYRIAEGEEPSRVAGAPGGASLLVARDGTLWLGGDALYRIDGEGRHERVFLHRDRLGRSLDMVLRAIAEDGQGRLWLSFPGNGLVRFDPASGDGREVKEIPGIPASLPEDVVNALMIDRSGLLWSGGQIRGAAVADPDGARFQYLVDLESERSWVDGNSARVLLQDDARHVWVGTDTDGLKRVDLDTGRFESFAAPIVAQLQPPHDREALRVLGLVPDGEDHLWVSAHQGLFRLDVRERSASRVELEFEGGDSAAPALRRADPAADGGLWIGTSHAGLLHFDPGARRVRQYRHDPTDPYSLSHDLIHCVLELADGRVWVCTNAGLNLLDPVSGHVMRFVHDPADPASLSGDRVRALLQGRDGSLWVGTHSGLDRLYQREDGSPGFERFTRRDSEDERGFTVFNLVQDEEGLLWLGTNEGILSFDTTQRRFRQFHLRDGLQDLEFNGGAQLVLDDGRILLGGIRGLNLFDPERLRDTEFLPEVRLLGARFGGATENVVGLQAPERLELPQRARMLRLQFGALDYASPASLRYRYRLQGFDDDWIEVTGRPEATYTNLRRGDYLFQAQATNRDGVWSPHTLELALRVMPPWWATPAAQIIYLLLLGLAGWGLWQLVRQRRRQEKVLLAEIRERDERLKLALWGSGDEFWDWSISDNTIYRMGGEQLFSWGGAAPLSTNAWRSQAIHPDDLPRVQKILEEHILGESEAFESEHRIRSAEGGWLWVRSRGKVVERDAEGHPLRIAGTAHDITSRRDAEHDRRIASEVIRSMAEAVGVVDLDFRFVSVNPAFSRITGYAADEVDGADASILDSAQHDGTFYEKVRRIMLETGHWAGEMWQKRKDGEEFLGWLECSEVRDEFSERSHFVIVVTDVTDKKRAEQELRYLANYDTLTGLPNRALLSERLARAIVRARRQDTRVAVLFLDLDRFKDINDSLGHAAGDRILKATASRLLATVSSSDTVARLSGDEFTVVLEDVDSLAMVDRVAREILSAFAEPLDIDDRHDVTISPSIGISLYPDHALVPTDLLKYADTAMYQAKSIGRNTFQVYTQEMDAETRKRAQMAAALRRALDRGEFRLLFQPRLSLTDGNITGVEALLRWHSADLGEVPPDVFIPLAEETGLILKIGEWVLREACLTLRRWRRHGLVDVAMAVNVSVLQLLRGNLPDVLERVLIEADVPADRVELEVTESMVMANAEQTTAVLNRLRDIGVSIAIDDFGTGYSSLVYLKRLPIDTLKIDKEFIGDLTRDPDDEAITATVITMAHSLGLNVVAEGVETQAQMDYLREQGCDEIQGYWLSPPLDSHHCLAFMRTWQPSIVPEVMP